MSASVGYCQHDLGKVVPVLNACTLSEICHSNEDDITVKIADIVQINNVLHSAIEKGSNSSTSVGCFSDRTRRFIVLCYYARLGLSATPVCAVP